MNEKIRYLPNMLEMAKLVCPLPLGIFQPIGQRRKAGRRDKNNRQQASYRLVTL